MSIYPSVLPLPAVADYAVRTAIGVSAITFERGNNRQRRISAKQLHAFNLSFTFTTEQLWTWQSWANQYGYEWHQMMLESAYSGSPPGGERLIPHFIRYTSDINIETLGNGYLRVYVTAELDVNRPPSGEITPTGNWFVAGSPASPATDTITAGSPAAPASATITAGTPAIPAA